jgi:23S rRNA (adenine2503-C2)-methyltransferase
MENFFDLEFTGIETLVHELSQPQFRTAQIWDGIYQHLFASWSELTNLPKELRESLQTGYSLSNLQQVDEISSMDSLSTKFLFKLNDGNPVESVLLRSFDRITFCISTQSGCPVKCVFCATGNLGFYRNLSRGEIIEQVLVLSRLLKKTGEQVTNIVLMGMGEPFLNYTETLAAVRRINDPKGMNIGARRITISTIGIPEKILEFAGEKLQVNLAVSLHASNDVLRRQLVPLAAQIPIASLVNACRHYVKETNRRITFEYVLIEGVNDAPQFAFELAKLLKNMTCHVNLIGLNPTGHYAGKPPSRQVIKEFGRILLTNGIPVSVRISQGADIQAACGQLAGSIKGKRSSK